MNKNTGIDAVITWVDGNDETHRKKRANALINEKTEYENDLKSGKDKTRFVESGELLYCILSIRRFAPWIGKIFLVTDNQRPGFMTSDFQKSQNITIVDHTEIFRDYEWALPTFNTRTIEMGLWRIPEISDQFIYFNDDFVLTSPVDKRMFFEDEKIVLMGNWKPVRSYGAIKMGINKMVSTVAKRFLGITRSMHLLLQVRSALLAGFTDKYFRIPHVPYPVRKSTLQNFFNKNPKVFENNIKFKFRNTNQFSAIFLANHLEIKANKSLLKNPEGVMMLQGEMDNIISLGYKLNRIKNRDVKFLSIQGFERFKKDQQEKITRSMEMILK